MFDLKTHDNDNILQMVILEEASKLSEEAVSEGVSGRMHIRTQINDDLVLDHPDYVRHVVHRMYQKATEKVALLSIGVEGRVATKYFLHSGRDFERFGFFVELQFDCLVIPERTREIEIYTPSFTVQDNIYREWRCGYCSSPNEMKSRHCTQCGSGRELLIQEL